MNHLEGGYHTSMPSYDSFASAAIPPPPLTNQAELAPQGLLLETARMLIIGGNGGDLLRMVANTVQVRIVLTSDDARHRPALRWGWVRVPTRE